VTLLVSLKNEKAAAIRRAAYDVTDPNGIKLAQDDGKSLTKTVVSSGFGLALWAAWWVMLFR